MPSKGRKRFFSGLPPAPGRGDPPHPTFLKKKVGVGGHPPPGFGGRPPPKQPYTRSGASPASVRLTRTKAKASPPAAQATDTANDSR